MHVLVPNQEGLSYLTDLDPSIAVSVYQSGVAPAPDVDFLVAPFFDPATTAALLAQLPKLKVVQTMSAGVDGVVDLIPDGVTLADASGVHDPTVSEWLMTVILACLHQIPVLVRRQDRHEWKHEPVKLLEGARILVLGFGSIGRAFADRLAGFGVTLLPFVRHPREGMYTDADLARLLPTADVVVVLTPLTPETRGMVGEDFLRQLKDGALLVNAARGPVVNTDALDRELRTGRIFAALDVTDPEPLPADHPLWDAPNLLITPHVAGAPSAPNLMERVYALVRSQVIRYSKGEPLANVVHDGY